MISPHVRTDEYCAIKRDSHLSAELFQTTAGYDALNEFDKFLIQKIVISAPSISIFARSITSALMYSKKLFNVIPGTWTESPWFVSLTG